MTQRANDLLEDAVQMALAVAMTAAALRRWFPRVAGSITGEPAVVRAFHSVIYEMCDVVEDVIDARPGDGMLESFRRLPALASVATRWLMPELVFEGEASEIPNEVHGFVERIAEWVRIFGEIERERRTLTVH